MTIHQPRVGVGVFIFKDGKFLIGKRTSRHGKNTWAVPGGWLEYQEGFAQAARREVIEETGLSIKNIQFGALTNNIFTDEPVHSLTIWLTATWGSGEPVVREPDKYVEQQWVDFDSLPAPLFLSWKELLKSEFLVSIKERCAITKHM